MDQEIALGVVEGETVMGVGTVVGCRDCGGCRGCDRRKTIVDRENVVN